MYVLWFTVDPYTKDNGMYIHKNVSSGYEIITSR